MNRFRFKLSLLLIPVFLIFASPFFPLAHAQATNSTTIIPPSFELFANPGDTLKEKISVRNETAAPLSYNLAAVDFEAQGDSGEVQLVQGGESHSFSLASWISLDGQSEVDIPGHSQKDINFEIDVPQNAEAGGHYGAITITTQPGSAPGAANVSLGQVSLILLRVSGNITEKANIVSFTAPGYSEFGPVPINLKLANKGNVHIKPSGTIIITDLFGAKVAEIKLNGQNVLPGAGRIMQTVWGDKNPIGRYTATLVATYGENHESLLASTSFIVFPKPLALGIGIGIVAIICFILLAFTGRKRIAKAMKVIAEG